MSACRHCANVRKPPCPAIWQIRYDVGNAPLADSGIAPERRHSPGCIAVCSRPIADVGKVRYSSRSGVAGTPDLTAKKATEFWNDAFE
jgi:hypothetical protein